jgi:hypothetical protein
MQADTEHQQDHPNFGELRRKALVRHKPRGEGTDHHSGYKISDKRRKAQPVRYEPKQECKAETGNQRCNEGRLVRHDRSMIVWILHTERRDSHVDRLFKRSHWLNLIQIIAVFSGKFL